MSRGRPRARGGARRGARAPAPPRAIDRRSSAPRPALSRVLGLVREMVAAYAFGAAGRINAFTVAFQIPNLVRALVADTALSGAFVPVFSELLEKGERVTSLARRLDDLLARPALHDRAHRGLRARRPAHRRAVRRSRRGLRPRGRALARALPDRGLARALGDRRRDPQRLRPVHRAGADAGRVEPRDHRRPRARRSVWPTATTPSSTSTPARSSSRRSSSSCSRCRGCAASTAGCGSPSTGVTRPYGASSS